MQKDEIIRKRKGSSHLDADGKHETCLGEEGEGLVVCDVLPVAPHRVIYGCVGDKEEHQGAVAAVEGTLDEGLLAEVQVELTRNVELRMLETPHVVHILTSRGRQRREVCLLMFSLPSPRGCILCIKGCGGL